MGLTSDRYVHGALERLHVCLLSKGSPAVKFRADVIQDLLLSGNLWSSLELSAVELSAVEQLVAVEL